MKNKIFNFIKTHWFKLGIIVAVFIVAFSVLYYFFVFIPHQQKVQMQVQQQEKMAADSKGQQVMNIKNSVTQTQNDSNKLDINLDNLKRLKEWGNYLKQRNNIRQQLYPILESVRSEVTHQFAYIHGWSSGVNETDILTQQSSDAESLSLKLESLSVPNVPFSDLLVQDKILVMKYGNTISFFALAIKDNATDEMTQYGDQLNTISDQINNNFEYISADAGKWEDSLQNL